jgi:zinc protease
LGYPAGFERPAQLLAQLMQLAQFNLPDDYFADFEQRLASVTLADTHRVGEQYLATNRLTILVVGDRERIEQPLRDLGHPLTALDAEGAAVE